MEPQLICFIYEHCARHGIESHATQETNAQVSYDDVASDVRLSLVCGQHVARDSDAAERPAGRHRDHER